MVTFGQLLRTLRKNTYYPKTNKTLSQAHFAEELQKISDIIYSNRMIGLWEQGKRPIGKDSRYLLLSIIKVLEKYDGITTLEDANQLLHSADYVALTDSEIADIQPNWLTNTPRTYVIPAIDTQKAALPSAIEMIGREAAREAIAKSFAEGSDVCVQFIVGRGGVGKSTLAGEVARDALDTGLFPSVIWLPFGSAETNTLLTTLTMQLGQWLIPEGLDTNNAKIREQQIKGVLSDQRHLIVVDGVESAEHSDLLGQQLWRLVGQSHFIVTSRATPERAQQTFVCELDELDVAGSAELLKSHAKRSTQAMNVKFHADAVRKIFAHIGGHPLTLSILPELLVKFPLQRILNAIERGKYGAHHEIYAAAWQALSHDARKLLFALCFVSQHGIDEPFLTAVTGLDEDAQLDALEELFRYNLLQTRGSLEHKRYNLHNLTIQFVQIELKDPSSMLNSADFDRTHLTKTALSFWNSQNNFSTTSVKNLLQTFRFSFHGAIEKEVSQTRSELALILHSALHSHGIWFTWINILRKVIESDTYNNQGMQCRLLNILGETNRLARQFPEALIAYSAARELALLLEDEKALARATYGLGIIHYHQYDYGSAVSLCNDALEISQEHELKIEYASALMLRGLLGIQFEEFVMSENVFKQSIEIYRVANSHDNVLRGLNNLIRLYKKTNQEKLVLSAYDQAYRILEKNPNNVQEAWLKISEGSYYFERGDFQRASAIFGSINLRHLRQTRNVFLLALVLNNLGNVFLKKLNFSKAMIYIIESIELWKQLNNRRELANSLETLGDIYLAQQMVDNAIQTYNMAVEEIVSINSDISTIALRESLVNRLNEIQEQ